MQSKKAVVAGAAIVLTACGGSNHGAALTVTSTLEVTKTVTVAGPPPPSVPKTIMETDGTYRVGVDILPGTYRSAGPRPGGESDCYWVRLSSRNSTDVITNDISTGPQTVKSCPVTRRF